MTLTDLITNDTQNLFFQEQDFAVSVIYRRGADSCQVLAIVADPSQARKQFREGRTITGRRREWLIRSSDLSRFGTPAAGDLIIVRRDCHEDTYRVAPVDSSVEWEWSDPNSRIFRIRSVQVGDQR